MIFERSELYWRLYSVAVPISSHFRYRFIIRISNDCKPFSRIFLGTGRINRFGRVNKKPCSFVSSRAKFVFWMSDGIESTDPPRVLDNVLRRINPVSQGPEDFFQIIYINVLIADDDVFAHHIGEMGAPYIGCHLMNLTVVTIINLHHEIRIRRAWIVIHSRYACHPFVEKIPYKPAMTYRTYSVIFIDGHTFHGPLENGIISESNAVNFERRSQVGRAIVTRIFSEGTAGNELRPIGNNFPLKDNLAGGRNIKIVRLTLHQFHRSLPNSPHNGVFIHSCSDEIGRASC